MLKLKNCWEMDRTPSQQLLCHGGLVWVLNEERQVCDRPLQAVGPTLKDSR